MTTPNFNFQELHDFLFEPSTTAVKMESSSSSTAKQFDFEQVWTGLNVNAIEKSSALSASDNIHQQSNSLSTFIGDLTPAAAAVVAAESPMMNTPFLDHSCMNTPFTPASVFTPSLAHMQNSPFYSPYINNSTNQSFGNMNAIDNQDDVQVASYLKNDISWQDNSNATPAISTADLFAAIPNISSTDVSPELLNTLDTFNGDPSQLLLNNLNENQQATTTTTSSNDESSDFLFPPLSSDNQDVSYSYNANPTQDLDASNLFDDCFDDRFFDEVNVVPEVVVHQQPVIEQKETVSKKRKNNDSIANKNKRIKIASSNDQDQRKFECDICHATFNRRYNLGTHIKTHDKNRRKDFPCHLCQKFFDRKHDLTRHISTVHNGERAYACSECPSTFSRKDAMVRHRMQKHNATA
ncbi:hypothetical protein V8B55DRAFT_1476929 [Mucor lusitanicus]|uniref:C2H2-type domain-containing protein n=2 Tax=Mucor circinelloides f. lusitanicus TaxID=29924 RepID=A0A8H4BIE7_MUCCL|nr:hypothetical protein FB192DRAFT_1303861 [Mucor lusitanicus]